MFCSCVNSVMFWFCSKLSVACEPVISGTLRSAFEVVGIEVFSVFSPVIELGAMLTYVCGENLFKSVRGGDLDTHSFLPKSLASLFLSSTCFFNSGLFCVVWSKSLYFPYFLSPSYLT